MSLAVLLTHTRAPSCRHAYFRGTPTALAYTVDIPQHTVLRLVPHTYGWEESVVDLGADQHAVDSS